MRAISAHAIVKSRSSMTRCSLTSDSGKSEGVIPGPRAVHPSQGFNSCAVISLHSVIHRGSGSPEGGQGRSSGPVQEACRVRACSEPHRGEVQLRRERRGEVNRRLPAGGLILDIGLRGFLPASLVDLRRVKELTSYMGTRIEARVIEMGPQPQQRCPLPSRRARGVP